jgi:hypothetical protein
MSKIINEFHFYNRLQKILFFNPVIIRANGGFQQTGNKILYANDCRNAKLSYFGFQEEPEETAKNLTKYPLFQQSH